MNRTRVIIAIGTILTLSVALQALSIAEPLVGDASEFSILQREMLGEIDVEKVDLASGRGLWHPMAFPGMLLFAGKIGGSDILYGRLLGIACFLVNSVLVAALAFALCARRRPRTEHDGVDGQSETEAARFAAVLAVSLFAWNPLGLQLAMHYDIDNTVLTTALLGNVLYFVRSRHARNMKAYASASAMFALALWCKMTTPLLLIPAFGSYFVATKQYRRALVYPAIVFVGGVALFLTTWIGFCTSLGYPWHVIFFGETGFFDVLASKGSKSLAPSLGVTLRTLLVVGYWFSPFLIILPLTFGRGLIERLRRQPDLLFTAVFGAMCFGAYFVIGGIVYGVPKYHYPSLPILSAMTAAIAAPRLVELARSYTRRQRRTAIAIGALAALVLATLLAVNGDPLYHLNYGLKQYILEHQPASPFLNAYTRVIAIDVLLYGLVAAPMLALLLSKRGRALLPGYTLVAVIASYGAIDVQQARANYNTIYCYGLGGTEQLLAHLRDDSTVLLLEGALFPAVNDKHLRFLVPNVYDRDHAAGIKACIDRLNPDYFIGGSSINSLHQASDVFESSEFDTMMSTDYERVRFATFYCWQKKSLHRD